MTITTYINESDSHTLNKKITKIEDVSGVVFKQDTDILRPLLIISRNVSNNYNYVYIPAFNRYYYVRSKSFADQRYYVNLEVDPLMSSQTDINNLEVIADRSSSAFNLYQVDPEVPQLAPNVIATQKFPAGFGGYSFILAVTGGGRPPEPGPTVESEVIDNG